MLAVLLLTACGSGGGEDARSGGGPVPPPTAGNVVDGLGADVDTQTSTTTISARWFDFAGVSAPIVQYEWAIGRAQFGTDVQDWTPVGTSTTATNTSLSLQVGTTYYVSVQAYDSLGGASPPASSDGVQVASPPGGGGGGGGGGGSATMASTVGQWGITWQFDHEYQVGQFCNGDWWVVGPVKIVSFSPPTQDVGGRIINGSMINPPITGMHGYDSTLYGQYATSTRQYSASLNVALGVSPLSPLTVQPSSSLISTISQMTPDPNGSPSEIATAAVLTVLSAVPPADAFRPPYAGSDKTIRHRESDLDYSLLADLPPVAGAPSLASTATQFSRVWLDHCAHWTSGRMHPVQNMPSYYRDFTALTGTAGLLLNCNFTDAQKRDLLVRFVQVGIDWHRHMVVGARWGVNGHCNGRKFPILFAGKVLNDSEMLSVGTTYPLHFLGPDNPGNTIVPFSEDGQTFYVAETSPGVYNWGYGGYNASHVGLPEWGNFHANGGSQDIDGDYATWLPPPGRGDYRRCCSANGWVGTTLTMRAMGLQSAWAHQAHFDYMDRYVQMEPDGEWTESWVPWHASMWHTYRSQL
ncbi:MAG: fibronectin type III domain-containing protein [Planctomycetes bacterium]|nr:fibronectin type III domain-containing protein [Planctomycetota bacterium]